VFVTYPSLIARFESLEPLITIKRTTIRNLATRSQRSYSQSGAAHAQKLEKGGFCPRLDE